MSTTEDFNTITLETKNGHKMVFKITQITKSKTDDDDEDYASDEEEMTFSSNVPMTNDDDEGEMVFH